jgi:hypothetical protein
MKELRFPAKRIRSEVIADYLRATGRNEVVCFSCGNAAQALRDAGLFVVEVGPRGALSAARWFSLEDIAKQFPSFFDATSGHLSAALMARIGRAFRRWLGMLDPNETYVVPTGSGETYCCLRMAYPAFHFVPRWDDADLATRRDEEAPLLPLVAALRVESR